MLTLFKQALAQRAEADSSGAYRLFCGAREGISGLVVERFGPVAIFQVHEGKCTLEENALEELAELLLNELGLTAIYLKKFAADRSHLALPQDTYAATPWKGTASEPEITITEHGLNFLIRPYDGPSVGLFLDQRENRKFLSGEAEGKRVLNLFAYTCSFSVACAARGASVTSVDISKKYLEWGKRNFLVNGLPLEPHRFFARDVEDYLKSAAKKGEQFDRIILDPPSFGRGKGIFSITRDLPRLMQRLAPLTERGTRIFCSSNYSGWSGDDLQWQIESVFGASVHFHKLPPTPFDFAKESSPLSCRYFSLED